MAAECAEKLDSLSEVETQRVLSMVQQMWDGVYSPVRVRKYLRNVLPLVTSSQQSQPSRKHKHMLNDDEERRRGRRGPRNSRGEENANPEQAGDSSGGSRRWVLYSKSLLDTPREGRILASTQFFLLRF